MKQVENHKSKYVSHSCLDPRDSSDAYWKQKRSQSFPVGRSTKTTDPVASYYASTSYKPQRSHAPANPAYPKYNSIHSSNPMHLPSHSKPGKEKHYTTSFTSTRKNRYDEELQNAEKVKFIDEEVANFTDDNAEDDAEEEATEDDREEAGEFPNKDYEEQEADDEIDEESDASPQAHRAQRGSRNEMMMRQHRWRSMEQPEARRLCCQQHMALMQNHPSPSRYYHTVAEHEVPEPLSEEDFVRMSSKSPTRRQLQDYRQWASSRNETDRYDDVVQQTRRARTKPDLDRLIEAELYRTRRCNRCGNMSGKRNDPPTKNGCRFDDRANIPTKGPIGDEPESHEQTFCARCNLRHNAKETGPVDIPASMYATKLRRPRDVKSPTIYEAPEQAQVDKLLNDYSRFTSRYPRKSAELFAEKTKRSLHTSHGTARIPARFVE